MSIGIITFILMNFVAGIKAAKNAGEICKIYKNLSCAKAIKTIAPPLNLQSFTEFSDIAKLTDEAKSHNITFFVLK